MKIIVLAQQELNRAGGRDMVMVGVLTAILVVALNLGLFAAAQELEDAFNSVVASGCAVINLARSTLTWVILVGAAVVGGTMRQFGNPMGIWVIGGAIMGTVIVIGAAGLATTFFVDAGDCIEDVGTAN